MLSLIPSSSVEAMSAIPEGYSRLCYSPIDVPRVIDSVQDSSAGAISVFIGTTRNSFQGKAVTHLEYQAYSKLAIKTMSEIIRSAAELRTSQEKNDGMIQAAIQHRLGPVPIGEVSIVIAVSSPHRKEAFNACEYILEQVKQKAQIWKREYYAGEPEEMAQWKANY